MSPKNRIKHENYSEKLMLTTSPSLRLNAHDLVRSMKKRPDNCDNQLGQSYSCRSALIGLAVAALIDSTLTVKTAITSAITAASRKYQGL